MDDNNRNKDFEQILREDIARHNSDIDNRLSQPTNPIEQAPPSKKRKRKPVVIASISVAALIIISVCGFMFWDDLLRVASPKYYVAYAVHQTKKDLDYGFDSSITEMFRLIQNGSHKKSTDISLNSIELDLRQTPNLPFNADSLGGFGVSLTTLVDRSALHALNSLALRHSEETLISADFYVANDKIGLKVPELYDLYFVANPNNLAASWDNAPIGSMIPYPLDRGINTNIPYDTFYDNVFSSSQGEVVLKKAMEAVARYQDDFSFASHGKTSVTVNRTLMTLSHISISISKDKFDSLFTDLTDILIRSTSFSELLQQKGFSASSADEVVLNLYTNSENKIVKLDFKLELNDSDNESVVLEPRIELGGASRVFDLINVGLKISDDTSNIMLDASMNQSGCESDMLRSLITVGVTSSDGYYYDTDAEISVGLKYGRNPIHLSASIEGYDNLNATIKTDGEISFEVGRIAADFDNVDVYLANSVMEINIDLELDTSIGDLTSVFDTPGSSSVDFLSLSQMDIYNILLRSMPSVYKVLQSFGVNAL